MAVLGRPFGMGSTMGYSGQTGPMPVLTCLPEDWWDPAWQAVQSPGVTVPERGTWEAPAAGVAQCGAPRARVSAVRAPGRRDHRQPGGVAAPAVAAPVLATAGGRRRTRRRAGWGGGGGRPADRGPPLPRA